MSANAPNPKAPSTGSVVLTSPFARLTAAPMFLRARKYLCAEVDPTPKTLGRTGRAFGLSNRRTPWGR